MKRDNLTKITEKTLKNGEKVGKFDKSSSYYDYLKTKIETGYTFELFPSRQLTLFKVRRVIKDLPSQLKEWYSYFDGGRINSFEIFSATRKQGLLTLKEANSKSFITEKKLPNKYFYIGRMKDEYYIGLDKYAKQLEAYNNGRNFYIVTLPYDGENKSPNLDFYEILDFMREDDDD